MLSKTTKRQYIILEDDQRVPLKLNKQRTDNALKEITLYSRKLLNVMENLYRTDYDVYRFIASEINSNHIDFEDGHCDSLRDLFLEACRLEEFLHTHQDEIPSEEDMALLEDLGFKLIIASFPWFEKEMEKSDEKDVTEEIILHDGKILHRLRTIYWDITSHGKSSKEIVYKDLPVQKKLKIAIKNSVKKYQNIKDKRFQNIEI